MLLANVIIDEVNNDVGNVGNDVVSFSGRDVEADAMFHSEIHSPLAQHRSCRK